MKNTIASIASVFMLTTLLFPAVINAGEPAEPTAEVVQPSHHTLELTGHGSATQTEARLASTSASDESTDSTPDDDAQQRTPTSPTHRYLASTGAGVLGMIGGAGVGGGLGYLTTMALFPSRPRLSSPEHFEQFVWEVVIIGAVAGIGSLAGTTWAVHATGNYLGGNGSALATLAGAVVGGMFGSVVLGPLGIPVGAVIGYELTSNPTEPTAEFGNTSVNAYVGPSLELNPDERDGLSLGLQGRF